MTTRRLLACALGVAALSLGSQAQNQPAAEQKPTFVPTDHFAVPEGLEVTVWATSPMLFNPTNLDTDEAGRIWVAEGVNYRSHAGRRPEGDRIMVLEDTDGDGKADKSHVFVQEKFLEAPLGVAVMGNKVIVSQTPSMIVYTDVNNNQVFDEGIDKREVLLTGFNGRNHDHSLHSVTAGPDGLWYWNSGNCGAVFTDKSGKTFRIGSPYRPNLRKEDVTFDPTQIAGSQSDDGNVWIGGFSARMKPDGTYTEIIGFNYRNSFEQTVNSFGDVFQNDNDDPPACRVSYVLEYGNAGFASRDGKRSWRADMRPGQTIQKAEWRQDDPGTMPAGDVYGGGSPTGVGFYENGALGKKWEGLLLACEAGRNVVFGYMPKLSGAGFQLDRFDFLTSNKEKEFAGSDFLGGNNSVNHELKTLFRPSDVLVGVDGAIYVSDWFDARVGGHADLDTTTSGTIYRIAPKGFKPKIPKFDLSTTAGQIEALKSPAVNVRNLGFTRLQEQGDKAVAAVSKVLNDRNEFIAARAIWLLAQMGPKGVAKVETLLKDKDEKVRLVAYRALRRGGYDIVTLANRLVNDASPAVRREVALSLRDQPLGEKKDLLVRLAEQFDGKDRTYLEAFGTAADNQAPAIYAAVSQQLGAGKSATDWSDSMGWIAWRLGAPKAVADMKARALSDSVSADQRKRMMDGIAFIKSKEAAMAMVDLAKSESFPLKAEAMWWLFNRMGNDWKDFGLAEVLKKSGLYDPDTVQISAVEMPPAPTTPSTLPPIKDILALKGDVARGKTAVVVCYTCHRIGDQGVDFGPDLTQFGKQQTREVVLNAIINPSAEISHGYEGSELIAKDGTVVVGMVLANGDPTIIKSMAGQTQTIPRKKIKSVKKMDRSLMFSADMLGLDAQALADIVAYMQSNELK